VEKARWRKRREGQSRLVYDAKCIVSVIKVERGACQKFIDQGHGISRGIKAARGGAQALDRMRIRHLLHPHAQYRVSTESCPKSSQYTLILASVLALFEVS
jgi:hypothetical protein